MAFAQYATSARRYSRRRCRAFAAAMAFLAATVGAFAQQKIAAPHSPRQWEVLEHCQFLTNQLWDGDSFHVRHQDREYIFRLYFVDAPETDFSQKERIVDQAAYFGIRPADIPRGGLLAKKFTESLLRNRSLTIITRWRNAGGRSALARYYSIVFVGEKNLAFELVAHGLARIYGYRANWPDGPRSTTFINQLKHAELQAREKGLGIWEATRFPPVKSAQAVEAPAHPPEPPPPAVANHPADSTGRINLNTASLAELESLPGIGPVLARRIVAHRPFTAVDQLTQVKGIGKKTLQRLRPLVTVSDNAAQDKKPRAP